MTKEDVKHDLQALIEYFNDESGATPMCLEYCLNMLEQEPCEDAISRDKAIVQLSHLLSDWDDDWNVGIRKCIETVKSVPSVQPKKGEWIKDEKMSIVFDIYRCSRCSADGEPRYNFCPNCGSDMRGEADGKT